MRRYHEPAELVRKTAPAQPAFPLVLFTAASTTLAGLYYQLLIDIPRQLTSGRLAHLGDTVERVFETLSVSLGSMPLLALAIFAALLAPGFLRRERARRHFLTLTLCALGLWAVCFAISGEPARRLGVAIHDILSVERPLPPTIQGH